VTRLSEQLTTNTFCLCSSISKDYYYCATANRRCVVMLIMKGDDAERRRLKGVFTASETWTLLKADIAKLETFHMTNQRRILGIFWYEFVTNEEVATLSQLPSIYEALSRRETLSLARSGVWIRLLLPTKPYISQSRHDRAQDSLTPGGDNQVVRKNAGWSRSPRAQGSLLLMLGVTVTDRSAWRALRPVDGQA